MDISHKFFGVCQVVVKLLGWDNPRKTFVINLLTSLIRWVDFAFIHRPRSHLLFDGANIEITSRSHRPTRKLIKCQE